eukprot:jgi/Chrzof1/13721/Cz08g09150.t1
MGAWSASSDTSTPVGDHGRDPALSTTTQTRKKSDNRLWQLRRSTLASRSQQQQLLPLKSPAALVAMGAVSVYCGLKGIIQGYQQLRRRSLRHLLCTVAPVLDDLGVPYWADFGTLLGMYREKDIILHDNDVDIVVFNPDWDMLLAKLKKRLPQFKVYFCVPSEDRSIRWIRIMCGPGTGIMDLYGGYDSPAGDHVSIAQGHGDLCDVSKQLVLPLSTMKFMGTSVSVPADVPGVLTYRYGETFMIPRYMDKGRDSVEQGKVYARVLTILGKAGLRV